MLGGGGVGLVPNIICVLPISASCCRNWWDDGDGSSGSCLHMPPGSEPCSIALERNSNVLLPFKRTWWKLDHALMVKLTFLDGMKVKAPS